ncbi:MAG: CopG family transcriptional regulator [Acidobacteria bacterium]|nr:CopG family transcriptional regulator [Acidobacteriota bacterium]
MRNRSVPCSSLCTDAACAITCVRRMTISLEDPLAEEVRREAGARGLSVSVFIAQIVDEALKRPEPT